MRQEMEMRTVERSRADESEFDCGWGRRRETIRTIEGASSMNGAKRVERPGRGAFAFRGL